MGSLRSHPYGIELHPVTGIARITCKQEEPSAPSPPAPTTTAAAAQRALAEHGWPDDAEPRVRVGIHTGEAAVTDDDDGEPTARLHLAFQAPDRDTVDAFYEPTVAASGRENGARGERGYHPATTPPTSSTPIVACQR
jgi:hypothetical protein